MNRIYDFISNNTVLYGVVVYIKDIYLTDLSLACILLYIKPLNISEVFSFTMSVEADQMDSHPQQVFPIANQDLSAIQCQPVQSQIQPKAVPRDIENQV